MQATHNASNCTIVLQYYWKGTCISHMKSKPGEEDVRDEIKLVAVKWMVADLRSGKTKEESIATCRSTIDDLERRFRLHQVSLGVPIGATETPEMMERLRLNPCNYTKQEIVNWYCFIEALLQLKDIENCENYGRSVVLFPVDTTQPVIVMME
jgi:hypothetical protein